MAAVTAATPATPGDPAIPADPADPAGRTATGTGGGGNAGDGGGQRFVAIDGGNSKTDVVVGSAAGEVLGYLRGPRATPHALGVDGTVAALDALIGRARAAAGLAPEVVLDRAEIYLAGADLPVEVDALSVATARYAWAAAHRVDNDTFALLRAGTDAADAVAVVCGAGINCVGRAANGRTVRFPSLGQISGDWGGGHHLATLALWHAARGEDGRGPATGLSAAVAAHYGLPTVAEVGVALHLGELARDRMDELSAVLFAVAEAGDLVARRVVNRQADEIINLVTVAANRLGLRAAPYTVVLGGSVLGARHPLLHGPVVAGLAVRCPRAEVTLVDQPPVVGAALLALDALAGPPAAAAALREALRRPPERLPR